ncbi:hypothetical protein HJG60_011042 [Phyllostomus discolor]|uniref:Uncharacterized protein n=1 Tax=Phyllostomus discolor TaxID=89673 RepID=A0A834EAM5_9CHIR|nr:hypothetical protein HJG60_011042 [Phyllostomus discolor]
MAGGGWGGVVFKEAGKALISSSALAKLCFQGLSLTPRSRLHRTLVSGTTEWKPGFRGVGAVRVCFGCWPLGGRDRVLSNPPPCTLHVCPQCHRQQPPAYHQDPCRGDSQEGQPFASASPSHTPE